MSSMGESALEFLLHLRSSASSSTSPGSLRPLCLCFRPEEQAAVWNRQQQVSFALSGQGRPATHFVISPRLLNITKCSIVCQATQDCIFRFIGPEKASFSAVEEAAYWLPLISPQLRRSEQSQGPAGSEESRYSQPDSLTSWAPFKLAAGLIILCFHLLLR